MGKCITYMVVYKKKQKGSVGKVVLMGSSTGANDIMWYLTRGSKITSRPRLDGVILQRPVSDQDYIAYAQPNDGSLKEGQALADSHVAEGRADEPMPLKYEVDIQSSPLTAYRFHSLSTYGGDDDFFSVNTSASVRATTFGSIEIPLLVHWSGADEYVPPEVYGQAVVDAFVSAQKPQ